MRNIFIKLILRLLWISVLFGCSSVEQVNKKSEQLVKIMDSTVRASSGNDDSKINQGNKQLSAKEINLIKNSSKEWKATKQKLGQGDLIDVFFVDEKHGWVISNDELVPESGKIYKTTNGGNSWIQLPLNLSLNSFISKIFFLSESRGWMVIQTESQELKNIVSEIQILETNDGGRIWKLQYSLKEAFVSNLVFDKTTGEGWLVGLKGKATYSFKTDALALHTLDFGKTWNDVSPKFVSENQGDESVLSSKDSLKDIQLIGNLKAFAISRRGQLLRTSDGGKNWETIVRIFDERNSLGIQNLGLKKGSKIWATHEACSIEGQWTLLAIIKENSTIDKYLLNEVCIPDVSILPNGELIACGLKMSLNKAKDRLDNRNIVVYSRNYEDWEIIYEDSCVSNCGFNKVTTDNNGRYFFVGNNGLILSMSKK